MNPRWTNEEKIYLKENYNKLGAKECSEYLCRPLSAITTKANRLNISFNFKSNPKKINYKICNKCKIEKNKIEFSSHPNTMDKLQPTCKECSNYREKQHRIIHNTKYKSKDKNRYWANPIKARLKRSQYVQNNKEKIKIKQVEYSKKWRTNIQNKEKVRNYQRKYSKFRRKIDPHYAIRGRLTGRIRDAIKYGKGTKQMKSMEYTGCSLYYLKNHIESQFTEGMSWEKFMNSEIEIDHIKPCCSFDLTKIEDQKACFHYTNLRPLWKKDNRAKLEEDKKFRLNI